MAAVVTTVGGLLILAWGIALLSDFHGLGTRFIAHAARTARFSWQREVNPNNTFVRYPEFNRIGLGLGVYVIGSGWLVAAAYGFR